MSLAIYFHTLRYLRPVQLYGRVWLRLYHPQPELVAAPSRRPGTGLWCEPAHRPPSLYAPAGFRFLNESHALHAAQDWNHPGWEKLWLYHLHYFDDLNARDAAERITWHRDLIARWLRENPPAQGNGWEPYPLSLRIVNWIKWALAGNPLDKTWLDSLAVQARHLSQRLEVHLLGNHLFANAKALVFAGLFFSGPEAKTWLKKGLDVLRRELPEQVLADGGHFERSPMYHSIILEDLLDLLNLARRYRQALPDAKLLKTWTDAAQCMGEWLRTLCHPDGEIALFNDAALGMACSPQELEAYAKRLGLNPPPSPSLRYLHLPDTGYIRLWQGPVVAILDVGEIGPDYLPGHAHADTLSFELSLFGQRILVNSGTSCYGHSAERLRQRATAAHNTVVVDGQNSSEVWSSFRVARRARPEGLAINAGHDALSVCCGHDGYRRLPGRPTHWRRWELTDSSLTITDHIEGDFNEAVARFHFHPAVSVYQDHTGQLGIARLSRGEALHWEIRQGAGQLQSSTYHPHFGATEPNRCLAVHFTGPVAEIVFRWEL